MGENNLYTETEVLEFTVKILNAICVPMQYIDQIGTPIKHSIDNIQAVLAAIDEANAKKIEEQKERECEQNDQEVIEIMPAEEPET